jgi:myosin heavy subunit
MLKVLYNANQFLEKNRDNLHVNLIECMEESKVKIISNLFSQSREEVLKKLKSTLSKDKMQPTVASHYRVSHLTQQATA